MRQDKKKCSNHSFQYMKATLQKYTDFSNTNIYIFKPASGILQQLLSLKRKLSPELFPQYLAKALLISVFGMLTKQTAEYPVYVLTLSYLEGILPP